MATLNNMAWALQKPTADILVWAKVLHSLMRLGLVKDARLGDSIGNFSFQYDYNDMSMYLCWKEKPLGIEFYGESEEILLQKLRGLVALSQ